MKRKPSAVLILFVEHDIAVNKRTEVLFIRRSTRIGSHPGQIGFPGGRLEMGDVDPGMTALRETHEEVGLTPDKIQLVGMLPNLPALDGSLVFPVCGRISAVDCQINLNPTEVQDVLRVSIDKISLSNRQKFSFNMFGCWRDSFLYDCGAFKVWGLSAEILSKAMIRV